MTNTIKLSLAAGLLYTTTINANDDLGTITVSGATKSEQSIKDITTNVEVITNVELEEKNIKTVSEALNLVSGVSFTSNGGIGATTSISIRGSDTNRVLILVDGVRYQDPANISGSNIAQLMIYDIEKIEIIKGAQSGVWGADAAAGVVNIITKKAKKGTHGTLNAEFGSFQTKKYGATISHKQKTFDMKLSANKITSDGFTTQAPRGEDIDNFEDDSYRNTTLNLQTNYYINDEATVGFNVTDIDALKEYDLTSGNDITMKSDIDTKLYSLSYLQKYNQHKFKIKADKSDFKREEIGTVARFGMDFIKNFKAKTESIELSDDFKYNDDSFLLFGVSKSKDDVDYILTNDTSNQKDNNQKSVFLTNSNKFNNLVLTQSIRYDRYDSFDNKTTGKIGVKYNFTDFLYLSSNIGTAYNTPSVIQELNPYGAVNTDLNPENSKSADISIGYKDLKVTYFYNQVKDLIQWYDPDGFGGTPAIYKNLDGESKFKGLEVEYSKEVLQSTLLTLNYTYLSAKNKDKKYLARRAQENLKFGIDYYGISKFHIGLNGEYVGKRYDNEDKQGEQTGKYTIAHLNINYDFNKEVKIYGKIENITDKYYQTVDGFSSSPRAFYMGVKYSF